MDLLGPLKDTCKKPFAFVLKNHYFIKNDEKINVRQINFLQDMFSPPALTNVFKCWFVHWPQSSNT